MELPGVVAAMPEIRDSLAEAVTIRDRSDRIVFANRGGYGLQLLEAIATRWGTKRSDRFSVWFELAAR